MAKNNEQTAATAAADDVIQGDIAELAQIDAEIEKERTAPEVVIRYSTQRSELRSCEATVREFDRLIEQHNARIREIRETASKIPAAVETRRTSINRLRIFDHGVTPGSLMRLYAYDRGTRALALWAETAEQRASTVESARRSDEQARADQSVKADDLRTSVRELERAPEVRARLRRS